MAEEPIDEFFTNLYIWGEIQRKRKFDEDHA